MRRNATIFCRVVLAGLIAASPAVAAPRVLLTADGEGHTGPCESCPTEVGLGGLDRRATLIAQRRAAGGPAVLVEAGNFLAGPDTVDDDGRALAAAYARLGYDVVNVAYRDLRFGPRQAVATLAGLPAVSANLLDADTGKPLFRPFVVVDRGGEKTAFVGLTEMPDLDALPRLKEQLKEVRIDPPLAALDRMLPDAARAADRVVVVFYGSNVGLEAVRARVAGRCPLVLAGGVREVADGPVAAACVQSPHGKYVTELPTTAARPGDTATNVARQWPVEPTIAPDPAVAALLKDDGPTTRP